ncbi:putative dispersed gene family protein 1 (DGF-1) [Trypanosoma rangeli]|uniref:Putative dispersed gene family protein 1 (DGF-1) n=1 Tax=Trypanosoma rangeli TaxID=5698 RepID=A0A422NDQ3_TRYRA|nr:putative dispersed gene family protein 1 (DGF-1) [Trypanosoma rangeli]RNF03617.1 putative dispersed gene family protein 1 (DGF-1) [Trypanosoma rangeli]|eukprot:RNF03617.1 putative dispersed gene family protein 1 (DGF-1) [Trypanosoma rangeli]
MERNGINNVTNVAACGECTRDGDCFDALTTAFSDCKCECAGGGHGEHCLPLDLPRVGGYSRSVDRCKSSVDGCNRTVDRQNRTVACPALGVTTPSGRGLTLADIRTSSAAPKKLTVALPPGFRWARDTDLRPYLSFALASVAQPEGFSGQWGTMLRNATWERNATNPHAVLELTLPVDDRYFVGVDEKIVLRYVPRALHGGCSGMLQGEFTITSNTPPGLTRALLLLDGIGAGTAAMAVAAGGGFGLLVDMQTLGVFAMMKCTPAWERGGLALLPYFLSVFAGLGPLWMVAGNALIVAAFACVHYAATVAYRRCRGTDATSAWAAMRFPGLTYVVAYVMHPGICICSVFILAMPDAQLQHYVVGSIGVLYGLAFPAGVCLFLTRRCQADFTEYTAFSTRPLLVRWLYPVGYWGPPVQQQMYGGVLAQVRGGGAHRCVFELSLLCLVGALAALQPPVEKCSHLYFCMATVLLLGAGVLLYANMMRSLFLTVMHTAGLALLGALCLTNAAGYLLPGDGWVRAHAVIVLLLLCVLLAVTTYNLALWYVESRNWRHLRERQKVMDTSSTGSDHTEKEKNNGDEAASPVGSAA